jgi:hypothetical protein
MALSGIDFYRFRRIMIDSGLSRNNRNHYSEELQVQ